MQTYKLFFLSFQTAKPAMDIQWVPVSGFLACVDCSFTDCKELVVLHHGINTEIREILQAQ